MTTANILSQLGSPGVSTGFKNRIINGSMVISQRNGTSSVTPASDQYLVDRFAYAASQASKATAQQNAGSVTPPAGFINYLGITSSSAYTVGSSEQFGVYQPIEGLNVADLNWGTANAKTVTLSFWVRSSLTGTFGGSLRNSAVNRSYPFSYTINSANTWEYETITISGDTTGTWLTTNGVGIYVFFGLGVGATISNTAGAWAAGNFPGATGATSVVGTNGATFYITGVQLEVGTTATNFDFRSYTTELQLCQRYLPAYSGSGQVPGCGNFNNTTSALISINFPVQTRTAPTGVFTPNAALYNVGYAGIAGDVALSTIQFNQATTLGALYLVTTGSAAASTGNVATVRGNNASALFYFTGCEL